MPIAIIIVGAIIIALSVGGFWVFGALSAAGELGDRLDEAENRIEALRESIDDLLIGNVSKEDIRALLRRHFDQQRR